MSKTRSEIKTLKVLQKIGAKWCVNHGGMYDGRRTTTVYLCVGDQFYRGQAELSEKDTFNRKIGRAIALGRAYRDYKAGNSVEFLDDTTHDVIAKGLGEIAV